MGLNYDIDFLPSGAAGTHFAAFRDGATAEAARRASPRTIAILSEAGISLDCFSSGTPSGHYPSRDKEARDYLMACLRDALTGAEDDGEEVAEGDFDFARFLVAQDVAAPFGPLVPLPPVEPPRSPMPAYVAISVLAVAGYMAGFAVLS